MNMAKRSFAFVSITLSLILGQSALADIRIISSQKLNVSEDQLNSRYLLSCQSDAGLIEDTDTGEYFEISSSHLCEEIRAISRLADTECAVRIETSLRKVDGVGLECSLDKMLNH